jgi:hypothetical protein
MPFVHDFGDSMDNMIIGSNKVLRMNFEVILGNKEVTTSIAKQRIKKIKENNNHYSHLLIWWW